MNSNILSILLRHLGHIKTNLHLYIILILSTFHILNANILIEIVPYIVNFS